MTHAGKAHDIFYDIAKKIVSKYLAEVAGLSDMAGERPSFDVLLEKLRILNAELTLSAINLIKKRKQSEGEAANVESYHNIIKTSVQDFIAQLKN